MSQAGALLWVPPDDRAGASVLAEFLAWLGGRQGRAFPDHAALHTWSVTEPALFWAAVWDFFGVAASTGYADVLTGTMPDARWFAGARLNFAEHVLRHGGGGAPALICVAEDGRRSELAWDDLRARVAALAAWLRGAGVGPGDRVAAYLPNAEHAVIGLLAAASVGAVWACCSPDFGADGTVARLRQLAPTVLILADGYHWNGRVVDRRDVGARLRAELGTVRHVVHVPYAFPGEAPAGTVAWDEVVAGEHAPDYAQVEFSHPLWVLFSSGTTGLPKGLVHGHGGIVVEQLKWAGLYANLRGGERVFIYTSTGWVLWNLLVGSMLRGATAVLYAGSPGYPDPGRIWAVAAETGARLVGLGAALVTATQNAGIRPAESYDLSGLDTLVVSGSALPLEGYSFVRDHVSARLRIDSTSGGTDVATAFVGGNELSPVRAGEIAGPVAGVAVAAWDDAGERVVGQVGELVVTEPMPSMPLYFWNDPDGARYRESYFQPWPGVWRHGDWVTETERGTFVIHGRSDATLNRQGVRLGSAEFYEVVEALAEVRESLVVGAELPGGGYHLAMFVVPAPGFVLDDALLAAIRGAIKAQLTARHLPDAIVEAPGVPHTLTGKRLEVPVKRLLQGVPLDRAVNLDTVDVPDVLRWYADYGARLAARGEAPGEARPPPG